MANLLRSCRLNLPCRTVQVCSLSYCPLARCVLAAAWGGRMCIYRDAGADDPVRVLRRMDGHTQDITCLAFSVTLGLVATACSAGGVRVWDLDDAKLVGVAHTVCASLSVRLRVRAPVCVCLCNPCR